MLDPAAFTSSIEAHLESLSSDELRIFVLRGIKRLNREDRAQLALFLGHGTAGDPIDDLTGPGIGDAELRSAVERCGLLRERFETFLRDNPRAAQRLGIVAASDPAAIAAKRRAALKPAAIAIAALLLAVLPLLAQYVHQRGLTAGLQNVALVQPPIAASATSAAVRRPGATKRAAPRVRHHHARVAHVRPKRKLAEQHAVALRPARHSATVRKPHRTVAWKFDPSVNPYFNHRRWHTIAANPHPRARARNRFEQRAQLLVTAYLHDVVHGNTGGALEHLGMPRTADVSNVSERRILGPDSHFRVVAVNTQPKGAKVEVDINGRTGEYFEVFSVSHDGPAARIADRYYIPVNRTAEERAAHLLATDGH